MEKGETNNLPDTNCICLEVEETDKYKQCFKKAKDDNKTDEEARESCKNLLKYTCQAVAGTSPWVINSKIVGKLCTTNSFEKCKRLEKFIEYTNASSNILKIKQL